MRAFREGWIYVALCCSMWLFVAPCGLVWICVDLCARCVQDVYKMRVLWNNLAAFGNSPEDKDFSLTSPIRRGPVRRHSMTTKRKTRMMKFDKPRKIIFVAFGNASFGSLLWDRIDFPSF